MRKLNAFKNFMTGVIPFIVLIFIGFWKVNVWQRVLDPNIYALNQLFFQIFAYLSLAEAGIGALVSKEYYRLFAKHQPDEICIYYTLSKRLLRYVALLMMVLGLGISFFLPYLTKSNTLTLGYMQRVFILFLLKSLVEYMLFSPRFVLSAEQKIYKINIQMNIYKIGEGVMEVLLIKWGMAFELVLMLSFLLRIVMNLHINHIIYQIYPWLKTVEDTKGKKITGMSHVLVYKIVSVIHENVDLLLISAFINPLAVIIYSNYKYITKYISDFVYLLGSSLTSGLGDLMYEKDLDRRLISFEMLSTLFYFIGCFLCVSLGYCINSFMILWVGEGKLYTFVPLAALLFIFFHGIVRRPLYILKDIFALYQEMQLIYIAEAVLNLGLSLLLVHSLGIFGVLIATVLAIFLTEFWYFPLFLYRHVFKVKPWLSFRKYLFSLVLSCFILGISWLLLPNFQADSYLSWFGLSLLYALVVLVVLGTVFYICFRSFRLLMQEGLNLVRGLTNREVVNR